MKTKKFRWSTAMVHVVTGKWKTLQDMDNVYKFSFGRPMGRDNWNSEEHFGAQKGDRHLSYTHKSMSGNPRKVSSVWHMSIEYPMHIYSRNATENQNCV